LFKYNFPSKILAGTLSATYAHARDGMHASLPSQNGRERSVSLSR
jgi:hypothetical protein